MVKRVERMAASYIPRPVELEKHPKSGFMMTSRDHYYFVDGKYYRVPHGFVTDGASIPRIFRPVIGKPYNADYVGAALLHDYLYRHKVGTRKDADHAFFLLLRRDGVRRLRARAMWAAVRAFGGLAWRR